MPCYQELVCQADEHLRKDLERRGQVGLVSGNCYRFIKFMMCIGEKQWSLVMIDFCGEKKEHVQPKGLSMKSMNDDLLTS